MKQKILIYLCMNAIFSKTMQDTETKFNSLFLKVQQIQIWSAIVNTIFGSSLFTIEMLAFILQLKKFP